MITTACAPNRFSMTLSRSPSSAGYAKLDLSLATATVNVGVAEQFDATGSVSISFRESGGFLGGVRTDAQTSTIQISLWLDDSDRAWVMAAFAHKLRSGEDSLTLTVETEKAIPRQTTEAVAIEKFTLLLGTNIWERLADESSPTKG